MSFLDSFDISASGLTAERQRTGGRWLYFRRSRRPLFVRDLIAF